MRRGTAPGEYTQQPSSIPWRGNGTIAPLHIRINSVLFN